MRRERNPGNSRLCEIMELVGYFYWVKPVTMQGQQELYIDKKDRYGILNHAVSNHIR